MGDLKAIVSDIVGLIDAYRKPDEGQPIVAHDVMTRVCGFNAARLVTGFVSFPSDKLGSGNKPKQVRLTGEVNSGWMRQQRERLGMETNRMPMLAKQTATWLTSRSAGRALAVTVLMAAAGSSLSPAAVAQTIEVPRVMTSEDALAAMPDPQGYTLIVMDDGLQPEAVQVIMQTIRNLIGETHFFGAVYAYLPEGSTELSMRILSGLHSPEAADRGALEDCEEERGAQDSPCRLLATILPPEWIAATDMSLSSDAAYAFKQMAPQMEKPLFLARSRDSGRFTMWSGKNSRQSALDECNELVEADGREPDCDVVVDDLAASDE